MLHTSILLQYFKNVLTKRAKSKKKFAKCDQEHFYDCKSIIIVQRIFVICEFETFSQTQSSHKREMWSFNQISQSPKHGGQNQIKRKIITSRQQLLPAHAANYLSRPLTPGHFTFLNSIVCQSDRPASLAYFPWNDLRVFSKKVFLLILYYSKVHSNLRHTNLFNFKARHRKGGWGGDLSLTHRIVYPLYQLTPA